MVEAAFGDVAARLRGDLVGRAGIADTGEGAFHQPGIHQMLPEAEGLVAGGGEAVDLAVAIAVAGEFVAGGGVGVAAGAAGGFAPQLRGVLDIAGQREIFVAEGHHGLRVAGGFGGDRPQLRRPDHRAPDQHTAHDQRQHREHDGQFKQAEAGTGM